MIGGLESESGEGVPCPWLSDDEVGHFLNCLKSATAGLGLLTVVAEVEVDDDGVVVVDVPLATIGFGV